MDRAGFTRTLSFARQRPGHRGFLALFLAITLVIVATPIPLAVATAPAPVITERVTVGSAIPDGSSRNPSVSSDGRFTAFDSVAINLVPNDTNGAMDAFVYDRVSGHVERVSVSSTGTAGNGTSYTPSISADGRFVAFGSNASNLVTTDTNGVSDIFVYDRQTGTTELVSVSSTGTAGDGGCSSPSISPDGNYVAYSSSATNLVPGDTNLTDDVFIYNRTTHATQRISVSSSGAEGNNSSTYPSVSREGRYVAFLSSADNLVNGDTNGNEDTFVHDCQTGVTERVSVKTGGAQAERGGVPHITPDGRYVAFASPSTDLVAGDTNAVADVFVRDRQGGTTERASVDGFGVQGANACWDFSISDDGRYLAFSTVSSLVATDTNGQMDAFVRDRQAGQTTRVSLSSAGAQSNGMSEQPAISGDGRYVAFRSWSDNLVPGDTNGVQDILLYDRNQHTTEWACSANPSTLMDGDSNYPGTNSDGSIIAFQSDATNLISGDTNSATDIFAFNTRSHITERVSVDSSGLAGNGNSFAPSVSADGNFIAYESTATNLVADDTNGQSDIFVYNRLTSATTRVSVSSTGTEDGDGSYGASISANGRYVAFTSTASTFIDTDTNGQSDIYVRDRDTDNDGVYDEPGAVSTGRVSIKSDGTEGLGSSYDGVISANGRYVAYCSNAGNLVNGDTNFQDDIFVYDRQTGQNVRVSVKSDGTQGDSNSDCPSISDDGRFVAFESLATTLVDGDTNVKKDIFVRDRDTDGDGVFDEPGAVSTTLASVKSDGTQGNNVSDQASISGNGRFVTFESLASNLLSVVDTNTALDVFIHDLTANTTERLSVSNAGVPGENYSEYPSISGDGRRVVYSSYSTMLVTLPDTNSAIDIFETDFDGLHAPTWPSSTLTATSVAHDGLTLNWSNATDTVGVTGYKLYKDGGYLASVSGTTTTYTVTGLTESTPYTFNVEAEDGSGNLTGNGPSVDVTTTATPPGSGGSTETTGTAETSQTPDNTSSVEFSDIATSHWAYSYISTLVERGIIKGYQDGSFRPAATITRAEFAKMICLAEGWTLIDPPTPSFSDVPISNWAFKYVETAKVHKAILGYLDGTFGASKRITRAEIASIIAKSMQLSGGTSSLGDISEHWAKGAINACVKVGIVGGYKDNTFKPNGTATRAEAAKMIFGVLGVTINESA